MCHGKLTQVGNMTQPNKIMDTGVRENFELLKRNTKSLVRVKCQISFTFLFTNIQHQQTRKKHTHRKKKVCSEENKHVKLLVSCKGHSHAILNMQDLGKIFLHEPSLRNC